MMPRPTTIGIRHEVLTLAREGMWQGAVADQVGLTRATVKSILQRHTAPRTLVSGKPTEAQRKTTPCKDRALMRMVREDRFMNDRALMARMRNLYGMRAGRKTINNQLFSRGHRAYRPTSKVSSCWLITTAVSTWGGHTGGRLWQWFIGSMSSSVTIPVFQLYHVDGRLRVRHLPG